MRVRSTRIRVSSRSTWTSERNGNDLMAGNSIQTVGRRKSAVARVMLKPGKGEWSVNSRPLAEYFPRSTHQQRIEQPLKAVEMDGQFDIRVRVRGGGTTGQAGAVLLGLARALLKANPEYGAKLRELNLLSRDPRKVERKKYGQRGARRRFQFSKR